MYGDLAGTVQHIYMVRYVIVVHNVQGMWISVERVKKRSIVQYPVLRTVQSALHFTSLTDLFTQTPSRLLWEASSHMQQLMREGCSYIYPPLSIAMYSFIQLSELEQCRLKKLAQGFNTTTQGSNLGSLVESPNLYPWAIVLSLPREHENPVPPFQTFTSLQFTRMYNWGLGSDAYLCTTNICASIAVRLNTCHWGQDGAQLNMSSKESDVNTVSSHKVLRYSLMRTYLFAWHSLLNL